MSYDEDKELEEEGFDSEFDPKEKEPDMDDLGSMDDDLGDSYQFGGDEEESY